MTERKLGLGMGEQDKRVEELENTLKWVMNLVDHFLDFEDLDKDATERAEIMAYKVENLLRKKDARIQELEKELQRRKFFGLMGK